MHRFYQHVKTAPGAACSLRCCGNKFANRILRNGAGHRNSRVLPKMRRYVRHAEAQAVRREIQAQLEEELGVYWDEPNVDYDFDDDFDDTDYWGYDRYDPMEPDYDELPY